MANNYMKANCQEHIIKQWIDECSGKFIDPITVTDAVITKHGDTLTKVLDYIFEDLHKNESRLSDLKLRVEDLEDYKSQFIALKKAFDNIRGQFESGIYATRTDLERVRTELHSLLSSINSQLQANTNLFTQLLTYLSTSGHSGSAIDIGDLSIYLKTTDLLSAIRALNTFVEKVKSVLTDETYAPYNGLVTLPPTVGGALYVGDNADSGCRFYFTLDGDVNGDGFTNAADITALYNYILNGVKTPIFNGDQNKDGSVNAGDVTMVYNIILNGKTPEVYDKVSGQKYVLPVGTVFVNGKNVYQVYKDTNNTLRSERIGVIYDPNSAYSNISYTLPAGYTHHTMSVPTQQPITWAEPNEVEKAVVKEGSAYTAVGPDAKINVDLIATATRETDVTEEQRRDAIKVEVSNNIFDSSVMDYADLSIYETWKGLPQDYAQGIAYLKGYWDTNNSKEIQKIQPLGSFIDFLRFLDTKKYIDVLMYGSDDKYNTELTRFTLVDISTIEGNLFTGNERVTILAEYTSESGKSYYFYWSGVSKKKPVIIEKDQLTNYLNSLN